MNRIDLDGWIYFEIERSCDKIIPNIMYHQIDVDDRLFISVFEETVYGIHEALENEES